MNSILIRNGKVVDPENKRNSERIADIFIRNGRISKIGRELDRPSAEIVINARGKVVTAGLIDMHVHLREPGEEGKETIATATRAAAVGGITTVLGMPNTRPPIDNQTAVRFVLDRARETGIVSVLTAGCLTKKGEGRELAEIGELKKSGATAIIDDGPQNLSMDLQRLALDYCRSFGMLMMAHAEDADLKGDAVMSAGWVATQLGLAGSPASTETLVVARTLELLREIPTPYHFTHISAARTVELIRAAKADGLPVTCDVTTHHLALTDAACLEYNTLAKVAPPIRSETDRAALLAGVADGTIDAIISDHAPHSLLDKFVPFTLAMSGIVGLETLFPIAYTELVTKKILKLPELIRKLTTNPARILGISKGVLAAGADADVTVWDLKTEHKIDKNKFKSKGRNTPFHGKVCRGFARDVIVGGRLVVRKGALLEN